MAAKFAASQTFLLLCLLVLSFASDDENADSSVANSNTAVKTLTIQGRIVNEQFMRLARKNPVRVLLNDGEYSAIVRSDGSFNVHDVSEGVHFLFVDAVGFHFESVRLEVFPHGSNLRVKAYTNNEMIVRLALPYPLRLMPTGKLNYFVEREKFDPMVYLKNPMVLIVGVSMLLAFVMPKMVDNLSEEDKAKLKSGSAASMLKGQ